MRSDCVKVIARATIISLLLFTFQRNIWKLLAVRGNNQVIAKWKFFDVVLIFIIISILLFFNIFQYISSSLYPPIYFFILYIIFPTKIYNLNSIPTPFPQNCSLVVISSFTIPMTSLFIISKGSSARRVLKRDLIR